MSNDVPGISQAKRSVLNVVNHARLNLGWKGFALAVVFAVAAHLLLTHFLGHWSLGQVVRDAMASPAVVIGNTVLAALATVLLLVLVFAGFSRADTGDTGKETAWWRAPWLFAILTVVVILLWRWPVFGNYEFDPDESEDIAGAITLLHDFRFWVSVAVGTHGPLIVYPLTLPALLGMRLDYGSARLVGVGLMTGSVFCLYGIYSAYFSRPVSRLLVLPLVLCLCWVRNEAYLAYNGEHATIACCLLAAFLAARALQKMTSVRCLRPEIWAGIALGCIPYTKPQGVPMATVIGLVYLFLRLRNPDAPFRDRLRCAGAYVAAIFIPTAFLVVYLLSQGALADVFQRYIVWNLIYASKPVAATAATGAAPASASPFDGPGGWINIFAFFRVEITLETFGLWFIISAAVGFVVGLFLRATRRATVRPGFLAVGLLFFAAAVYCIYAPHRAFVHYLLLLLFPAAFLSGGLWGSVIEPIANPRLKDGVVLGCIVVSLILPILDQFANYNTAHLINGSTLDVSGKNVPLDVSIERWSGPLQVACELRDDAAPEDSLTVWGGAPFYYVLSGLRQATPQSVLGAELDRNDPLHAFFYSTFLQVFRKAHPPVFVDETGPESLLYKQDDIYAHDTFPEMRQEIASYYTLVSKEEGARIYVRNDRLKGGLLVRP